MAVMSASAADYSELLHSLRPQGPAMSDEDRVLQGLAEEYARLHNRAGDLLRESDPRETVELLPEWEYDFGLPDPCIGSDGNYQQRVDALVARVRGAQTPMLDYFQQLAATLGYDVRLELLRPHDVLSGVGDALYPENVRYVIRVIASLQTVVYADVLSSVTTPLARWGNSVLECVLRRAKPAHVFFQFIYVDPAEELAARGRSTTDGAQRITTGGDYRLLQREGFV